MIYLISAVPRPPYIVVSMAEYKINGTVVDRRNLCALAAGDVLEVGNYTAHVLYVSVYDVVSDSETVDCLQVGERGEFTFDADSIVTVSRRSGLKFPNSLEIRSFIEWTPHFSERGWLKQDEDSARIRANFYETLRRVSSARDVTRLCLAFVRVSESGGYTNRMPRFDLKHPRFGDVSFARVDGVVKNLPTTGLDVPLDRVVAKFREMWIAESDWRWYRISTRNLRWRGRRDSGSDSGSYSDSDSDSEPDEPFELEDDAALAGCRSAPKIGNFFIREDELGDRKIFDSEECITCLSDAGRVTFYECRHRVLCETCAARLIRRECPMCFARVSSVFPA